jgi:hypothetical protein
MEDKTMPKRIIDGDSLWVSEKLSTVPERYRVEYAWILPLAQANGCFECSPMLVWRTCYSALRTDWTTADVAAMLDAFETAKMLFRFQIVGKTYAFFPGVQKSGRLPKPSERIKYAAPWNKGMVPAKELAKFLGLTARDVSEEYKDVVASKSRVGRESVESGSPTGSGIGIGIGNGSGVGKGSGLGFGNGVGEGAGGGDEAASHITAERNTLSPNTTNTDTTEHSNTASPNTPPSDAKGFARLFHSLMESNPYSTNIPTKWEPLWVSSFNALLRSVSASDLFDIILVSQLEKNQPYYIRPVKLVENLELLQEMVNERRKALPALRAEFRKKLASPISAEEECFELEDDDDDLA